VFLVHDRRTLVQIGEIADDRACVARGSLASPGLLNLFPKQVMFGDDNQPAPPAVAYKQTLFERRDGDRENRVRVQKSPPVVHPGGSQIKAAQHVTHIFQSTRRFGDEQHARVLAFEKCA
jgi:hypothetical protein